MEDSGRRPGRAPWPPDGDAERGAAGQGGPRSPFAPATPARTPDGGGLPYAGGHYAVGPMTPPRFTPRPPPMPEDAGLDPGTMLGKYQIVYRLGSGGMGSVYEAIHTEIAKPVALKTLSPRLASEPRAQARFLREAAAASRLNHPHVVDVNDFGAQGAISFIVMELLRGEDLGALLAREPSGMLVAATADIMLAVCAGVFAAHEAGIIHRDLKPQNIYLARTPLGDVVPKVLDFGISKLLDERMAENLTGTGTVMGTTPYLSPEQVAGHPVDGRSDQYTLGVILYECVTGRRPHDGDSMFAIMRSIADGQFVRPRQLRPDLPPAFEALILRAMGHPPDHRFESVHALGQALLPFASPRGQVLWGDYFTAERGVQNTAPLPAQGFALPEPAGFTPGRSLGHTPGGRPLPSTHSGGRRPVFTPTPPPRSGALYTPVDLRPRRWPTVVAVTLVLAALGGGGLWFYRDHLPAWLAGQLSDSPETVPPTGERAGDPGNTRPERAPPTGRAANTRPGDTTPTPEPPPIEHIGRSASPPVIPPADDPVWPPVQGTRTRLTADEGATAVPARPVARPPVRPGPRPSRSHRGPARPRPSRAADPEAPILD
jgi:serine/threonine protein kinase